MEITMITTHSLLGIILAFAKSLPAPLQKAWPSPLNVNTAKADSLTAEKGGRVHLLPSQKLKEPVSAALEQKIEI